MAPLKHNSQKRRLYPRYPTRDNSVVMLTPSEIISYCVLDISKSGMAFCYNGKLKEYKVTDKAIATFFGNNIGSFEISVQIISDSEYTEDIVCHEPEEYKSKKPYLRRCGIKFNFLSQGEEDAVHRYIQGLDSNII